MFGFITANWEWFLLGLFVVEKAIKLSPTPKDDIISNKVLKPIVDAIKKRK